MSCSDLYCVNMIFYCVMRYCMILCGLSLLYLARAALLCDVMQRVVSYDFESSQTTSYCVTPFVYLAKVVLLCAVVQPGKRQLGMHQG